MTTLAEMNPFYQANCNQQYLLTSVSEHHQANTLYIQQQNILEMNGVQNEKTGHLSKEQRWRENGGKSSLLYTVKL